MPLSNASRRPAVEWPTVALIICCYGVWALACLWLWPQSPLGAVAILGLALAMQSSLMHEASHGHPTRRLWINEALVGLPIGLVYPFRRFRSLHLRHHADERLTDPFDDPESYYQALWRYRALPGWLRLLLKLNNTMAGRFVLGPWLASAGFLASEAKLIWAGDRAVRQAWMRHAMGLALVLPFVTWAAGIPFWAYLLGPVWLGQALISVRTFAEHQWAEQPDGRTLIVERSPFAFLFLNNNLHLVHHKNPTVAWYRLPALFQARREEWLRLNDGYVFRNYSALFRAFAFRPKEPVVHPVLRRETAPGTAAQEMASRMSVPLADTLALAEPGLSAASSPAQQGEMGAAG